MRRVYKVLVRTRSTKPGKLPRVQSARDILPIGGWPTGQGQLYVWKSWTAWLPRVTKRECTSGLPRESWGKSLGRPGHFWERDQRLPGALL